MFYISNCNSNGLHSIIIKIFIEESTVNPKTQLRNKFVLIKL